MPRLLDFIWHLRGSVRLGDRVDNTAVLERVERMLEHQRKPTIERGQQSVIFEEPLWSNFWGSNWRATVIYDHGRFWIDQDLEGRRLRYDLRSLHALIICLFGALMFFAIGSLGGDIIQGLAFAALAFAWLYGMNIVLAVLRVPALIRRSVGTD